MCNLLWTALFKQLFCILIHLTNPDKSSWGFMPLSDFSCSCSWACLQIPFPHRHTHWINIGGQSLLLQWQNHKSPDHLMCHFISSRPWYLEQWWSSWTSCVSTRPSKSFLLSVYLLCPSSWLVCLLEGYIKYQWKVPAFTVCCFKFQMFEMRKTSSARPAHGSTVYTQIWLVIVKCVFVYVGSQSLRALRSWSCLNTPRWRDRRARPTPPTWSSSQRSAWRSGCTSPPMRSSRSSMWVDWL